jgi:polar amino acid transport system permease protein
MRLELTVLSDYWGIFAHGLIVTIAVCVAGNALALLIGLFLGVGRLSRRVMIRGASLAYVEISRNLPFMVILYLAFFGFPVLGIELPAYIIGVACLAFYGSAYFAEIFRAAIQSIPDGQWDAAKSLGFSRWRTLRHIVLPQAMAFLIPPATNQVIMLLKESAVLSTITVVELTMAGQVVFGYTYRPIEIFVLVATLYWLLTTALAHAGAKLEALAGRHLQRERQ